ncbi:MAG: hypothetical protein KJ793_01065, partial [Candidatus Omnitrophica bacterium]|nr:hypothetical protein [Candidatus Omnitrophota bacterium]
MVSPKEILFEEMIPALSCFSRIVQISPAWKFFTRRKFSLCQTYISGATLPAQIFYVRSKSSQVSPHWLRIKSLLTFLLVKGAFAV